MRLVFGDARKGYATAVRDGYGTWSLPLVFFADSTTANMTPKDFWKLWRRLDGYDMVIGRKIKRSEATYRPPFSPAASTCWRER